MEYPQHIISPSIFVIILNWKGWQDTIECLESLLRNDYKNFRVVVIDNHSEDESYEKLLEWCRDRDRFSVFQTKANLFLRQADECKAGIHQSGQASTVVELNCDCPQIYLYPVVV